MSTSNEVCSQCARVKVEGDGHKKSGIARAWCPFTCCFSENATNTTDRSEGHKLTLLRSEPCPIYVTADGSEVRIERTAAVVAAKDGIGAAARKRAKPGLDEASVVSIKGPRGASVGSASSGPTALSAFLATASPL